MSIFNETRTCLKSNKLNTEDPIYEICNYFDSIKLSTDNLYLYESHLEAYDEATVSEIISNIGKGIAKGFQAIIDFVVKIKNTIIEFIKTSNTYFALRKKAIEDRYNKHQMISNVYDFKNLFDESKTFLPKLISGQTREDLLNEQTDAIYNDKEYNNDWIMQHLFDDTISMNSTMGFAEFKTYFHNYLRNTMDGSPSSKDIELSKLGTAKELIDGAISGENTLKALKLIEFKLKGDCKSVERELAQFKIVDPTRGNKIIEFSKVYTSYMHMYITEIVIGFKDATLQTKHILNSILDENKPQKLKSISDHALYEIY